MAIDTSADRWEQYLDQGWAPGRNDQRVRIGSRDDLYSNLLGQAAQSGLGGYTQQDIYDFFIRPGEQQRLTGAEDRFRRLYNAANLSSRQRTGQLANRLGFGGTSIGAQMARTVGSQYGGLAASQGLAKAQAEAAKEINSPNRLAPIEDLVSTARTRDERDASGAAVGGQVAGGLTGAALAAAIMGMIGAGVAAPVTGGASLAAAAPILAAMGVGAGAGTAAGTGMGKAAQADMLKKSDERLRRFRGSPLQMANFSPSSAVSSGTSFSPMGSNQFALSNANRGGSGNDTPFMYGA